MYCPIALRYITCKCRHKDSFTLWPWNPKDIQFQVYILILSGFFYGPDLMPPVGQCGDQLLQVTFKEPGKLLCSTVNMLAEISINTKQCRTVFLPNQVLICYYALSCLSNIMLTRSDQRMCFSWKKLEKAFSKLAKLTFITPTSFCS